MKRVAWLLFFSIGLNLVLAAAAFYSYRKPAPLGPTVAQNPIPISPTVTADTVSSPILQTVTNRFHWSQVESTNYDEYVSNLRAIGCPEKTLRDIISADVEKNYAERQRKANSNQPFWLAGKSRRAAWRLARQETEALQKEKMEWLTRLLGAGAVVSKETVRSHNLEEQALMRFVVGPTSEETFQKVVSAIERIQAGQSEINQQAGGILTDADEAALRGLRAEATELSRSMSPLEWDEFRARCSMIKLMNQKDFLEMVPLSALELRQIALISAGNDPLGIFDGQNDETESEREQREIKTRTKVAQLLGDERFAEFERAEDRDYRQIFEVAKDNELDHAAAVKVYEIRKAAMEELEGIRKDTALDDVSRQQRREQTQKESQQAIAGLIGAQAYQDYLGRGGAWMTNAQK